ncbi:putative methionine--tRNA ligase [Podosphaera aphanis]|nr:putative methionine--tRNA ligase [Podosphaera aphanis]
MNGRFASQHGKYLLLKANRVTARTGIYLREHKTSYAKLFSNSSYKLEKAYYVTTPIFYVNDAPHIGHLYSMVIADILKRWQVLKGNKAILCIGTDEHGIKIQRAAILANRPVKELCDSNSEIFKKLASRALISNDHFIRTTDPNHKEAVQYFWSVLKSRNLIYESEHQGWYCVSEETFYPESSIEKRLDPFTGRSFMASQETGKEVEWINEKNYHFRLSKFKEPLLAFYQENPEFVTPSFRMKEVIAAVSSGLNDLSISRPVERLSWGVPVPDDESQTIYVWLDALVNYLTKANYPWPPGEGSSTIWPANVHVVGKDIVRFHCIYWPAFLMAANLEPPKQILAHSHWTLGKRKMAKSTGNTVNPTFAIDRFGVDALRFYLAYDGDISNDSDYENRFAVTRYKKNLEGGLGNLLCRLTRSSAWNVRECIRNFTKLENHPNQLPDSDRQANLLRDLPEIVNSQMENLNVRSGLLHIMEVVSKTNLYLQDAKPWLLTKSYVSLMQETNLDPTRQQLWEVIYHCAESVRIVGILLQPYMPEKSKELLDILCVDTGNRSFSFAKLGADSNYGNKSPELKFSQYYFDIELVMKI